MDELNTILQTLKKTLTKPSWTLQVAKERLIPALLHPDKTSRELAAKEKLDIGYGLETATTTFTAYAIIAMILNIIGVAYMMTANTFFSEMIPFMFFGMIIASIIQLPLTIIFYLIVTAVGLGIIWWIGKLLGGQATYKKYYATTIQAVSAMMVLMLVYGVLLTPLMMPMMKFDIDSTNPEATFNNLFLFSTLAWGGMAAIMLIALIYLTVYTKNAHKISILKAFIATAIPMILPMMPFIMILTVVMLQLAG